MHLFFANCGYGVFLEKRIPDSDAAALRAFAPTAAEMGCVHHHVSYPGTVRQWFRHPVPVARSLADDDCFHWTGGGPRCRRLVSHHVDLYGGNQDSIVCLERQFYCADHVAGVTLRAQGSDQFSGFNGETVEKTFSIDRDVLLSVNLLAKAAQKPIETVISGLLRSGLSQVGGSPVVPPDDL